MLSIKSIEYQRNSSFISTGKGAGVRNGVKVAEFGPGEVLTLNKKLTLGNR